MITDRLQLSILCGFTLSLFCVVIVMSPSYAQNENTAQIQNFRLLTVDEPFLDFDSNAYPSEPIEFLSRFWDYDLSLDGRFVIARTQISSEAEVFSSSLYVWDLSSGFQEAYLSYVNSKVLDTEHEALSAFAIAPDSQHIAFFDRDQIAIYSLPDLNLVIQSQVFEITQVNRLNIAWSPDSSLIAVANPDVQLLRVWDWQMNEIYLTDISLQRFSRIAGTDTG